jgi:hypothetical protein
MDQHELRRGRVGLGGLELLCEREVDGVERQAAACACVSVPGETTRLGH